MKLTTPTYINVDNLVGRLNEALGHKFARTFYGKASGETSSLSLVAVGELERSDDSKFKMKIKYVVAVTDPHYEQKTHAPYGVYDLMGSDFEVMGDKITPEIIERTQTALGLVPVSR